MSDSRLVFKLRGDLLASERENYLLRQRLDAMAVVQEDVVSAACAFVFDVARGVEPLDEETVRNAQAGLSRSQSEGQKRMLALHEANRANGSWNDARSLEIAPNLWAGVGLVRGGAGTAAGAGAAAPGRARRGVAGKVSVWAGRRLPGV